MNLKKSTIGVKKYLSSYKLWNQSEKLKSFFWENKNIAYISNAKDLLELDSEERKISDLENMEDLKNLWLNPELLDLRKYFWNKENLSKKLEKFAGVYVKWWNVFVLNQAFKLSWFWKIMQEYEKQNKDFIYSWYSAGWCVLSPSMKWYHIVDDANYFPYPEIKEQIWEWIWLIDYNFSPHYKSEHPESKLVDEEIKYCIENKILFKAVRDWEVVIIE
jgi:dipeptidase E